MLIKVLTALGAVLDGVLDQLSVLHGLESKIIEERTDVLGPVKQCKSTLVSVSDNSLFRIGSKKVGFFCQCQIYGLPGR